MFNPKGFKRQKTIFPHRYSKIFIDYWWTKRALWSALLERLRMEKDAMILVTGDTGSGKSHFVGGFCLKQGRNEDNFILKDGSKMFNPKENYIIDPEEFAYKMVTKEGESIWGDEFRRGANRRSWYSPINKAIVDRKNTNRKLRNIYWLCMPYEKEFDPSLASHLTMWIWVRRGVGEVYVRCSGVKGGTGLNIAKILEREEKYLKENPKKTIVNPTIHPEYCGRIAFSKLTPKLEREYNELVKSKKATGDLSDEEKKKYGKYKVASPEETISKLIEDIVRGKIQDKKTLWKELRGLEMDDEKKLKSLNLYLGIEGLPTFAKLFKEKKMMEKKKLF